MPFGFVGATVYGWIVGLPEINTLILTIPTILGIASLVLIVTLVVSAVIMSQSLLLCGPKTVIPSIEDQAEKFSIIQSLDNIFRVPPPRKADPVSLLLDT